MIAACFRCSIVFLSVLNALYTSLLFVVMIGKIFTMHVLIRLLTLIFPPLTCPRKLTRAKKSFLIPALILLKCFVDQYESISTIFLISFCRNALTKMLLQKSSVNARWPSAIFLETFAKKIWLEQKGSLYIFTFHTGSRSSCCGQFTHEYYSSLMPELIVMKLDRHLHGVSNTKNRQGLDCLISDCFEMTAGHSCSCCI